MGPTFHSRESWQDPNYPVFGPADDPGNNDTVVLHYTAADDLIDGDPGEHAEDLPAYMRSMQYHYVTRRGYSLGYLFAVDWLGGIWQIRGWEFQSAANRGHNDHTYPILCLVDGAAPVTDEAAASIRFLVAEAERRSGRGLRIVGHGDIGSTPCPGVGIAGQIKAGLFSPALIAPEPLPTPTGPTHMIRISFPQAGKPTTEFVWTGTELAWVENGHAAQVLGSAGVPQVSVSAAQLEGVVMASATTTDAPWTLSGYLKSLWDSKRG